MSIRTPYKINLNDVNQDKQVELSEDNLDYHNRTQPYNRSEPHTK